MQKHIEHFCNANDGGSASPNNALLLPYDLKRNRMQLELQVAYSGERGQGAVYTVDEYVQLTTKVDIMRILNHGLGRHASQPSAKFSNVAQTLI